MGHYHISQVRAFDVDLIANGGWSLDLSEPILQRALLHVDNSCKLPNMRARGRIAKTNTESNTAFRGFGGPQGPDGVGSTSQKSSEVASLLHFTISIDRIDTEGNAVVVDATCLAARAAL